MAAAAAVAAAADGVMLLWLTRNGLSIVAAIQQCNARLSVWIITVIVVLGEAAAYSKSSVKVSQVFKGLSQASDVVCGCCLKPLSAAWFLNTHACASLDAACCPGKPMPSKE
jgi:hypothetical protein